MEHGTVAALQQAYGAGLSDEALNPLVVLQVVVAQDLQRDFPSDDQMPGPIDRAHAAFPQNIDDLVLVVNDLTLQILAVALKGDELEGVVRTDLPPVVIGHETPWAIFLIVLRHVGDTAPLLWPSLIPSASAPDPRMARYGIYQLRGLLVTVFLKTRRTSSEYRGTSGKSDSNALRLKDARDPASVLRRHWHPASCHRPTGHSSSGPNSPVCHR